MNGQIVETNKALILGRKSNNTLGNEMIFFLFKNNSSTECIRQANRLRSEINISLVIVQDISCFCLYFWGGD